MASIAIWSAGDHAIRNLLPAVSQAENVNLAGILSRDSEKLTRLCAAYCCKGWDSVHACLSDDDVDAVYIASPNALHFVQAELALKAGKSVWCEKSLTTDHEQTLKLVVLAQSERLVLAEAFMYLHHPQFKLVCDLIKDGTIGEVASIHSYFGFPHLKPTNFRYSSELGGGALNDIGAYCVSLILALAKIIGSDLTSVTGGSLTPSNYGVDTSGHAILELSNGTIGMADWGFGRSYRNEVIIWGTRGRLIVDKAFSKPETQEVSIKCVLQKNNEEKMFEIPPGANHFSLMMSSIAKAHCNADFRKGLIEELTLQSHAMDILRKCKKL